VAGPRQGRHPCYTSPGLVLEIGWQRVLRALPALLLACFISAPVLGRTPERPERAPEDSVWVWYRSGEGCPDGAAFIGLLRGLGRGASLAGVGDRVDFVVTLAYAARESSGRLERQSSERTVAIRDVTAASCAEVADVLALSLDLAMQPAAVERPAPAPAGASEQWQERIGVQGTVETGLAHALLPGAALFIDWGSLPPAWRFRLSLRGGYGKRAAAVALNLGLLVSRAEGCRDWSLGDVSLGLCGALDLGLVHAESPVDQGRSDTGFWGAAGTHLRLALDEGRPIALEGQVGLLVPLVHYRLRASTGAEVSDSAALGLAAALGVSFRF
jgi:hypothetical protein